MFNYSLPMCLHSSHSLPGSCVCISSVSSELEPVFVLCCRPLIFSPLSQVWNLVSLSWRIRMINFTSVSVYNRKQQVVWQHSNSKVNGNARENLKPRWNMQISIIENRFNVTSIQQNKKQMGSDISENVITAWKGEKRQRKRLTSVNVVV